MRIFKYALEVTDEQTIELPAGFKALTVQIQKGQLCLWALVEPSRPPICHEVYVVGTGNPAEHIEKCRYIGTAQQGQLVWHVFID